MPDRRTHRRAGRLSGGVYAFQRARKQTVGQCVTETIGGVAGGEVGALVADWLEPGISSWHRGPAHSCTAGVGILSLGEILASVESYCREQADRKAEELRTLQMIPDPAQPSMFIPAPISPTSSMGQLWLTICEFLWRAAAGFANGLAAGYLSHLVLDAGTPRSIPLLTNGF
jgi:hypothetical protein